MSLILRRTLSKIFRDRRCFSLTQCLRQEKELIDNQQLLTGLAKKEVNAYKEGNCDPFNIKVLKRGAGTKENPTLIPSAFNGRIVGCICEGNRFVNYMWLEMDCPKRCGCGHWFKLKKVENFI